MTVAVIGLIAVQLYWISNLIKVERERFHRNVIHSLLSVVDKIEKEEAAKTLLLHISTEGKKNTSLTGKKKGNTRESEVYIHDSSSKARVVKIFSDEAPYKFNPKNDFDSSKKGVQLRVFAFSPDRRTSIVPQRYVWHADYDTIVKNKQALVQKVITEMIEVNSQKKIEDRVSINQLNNLLKDEFSSRGIDTNFYFGVNKTNKDSLALLKSGADTTELKKSRLRTLLFPAEMFLDRNELVVYFPDEQRQILSSIAGMLGLSVGLILVIVGMFFKTVQMFLKQKKITQVKNDLINNITHEFKTPISTISLACEALNEPILLSEKNSVNRYSKIIREENNRLKIMVETLLNTAAMEKSEFNLSKEEIDLPDLIISASSKYDEAIKQKEGKIIFELNAVQSTITGDEFHLANIITNLIDNAIKYNERKPEITISTQNENKSIVVSVKDNGIGIPKEYLPKIFETFYRVSNGNIQNVRGNGIGLSYTKKIVEAHNGKISVSSDVGRGSEFRITLPLDNEL